MDIDDVEMQYPDVTCRRTMSIPAPVSAVRRSIIHEDRGHGYEDGRRYHHGHPTPFAQPYVPYTVADAQGSATSSLYTTPATYHRAPVVGGVGQYPQTTSTSGTSSTVLGRRSERTQSLDEATAMDEPPGRRGQIQMLGIGGSASTAVTNFNEQARAVPSGPQIFQHAHHFSIGHFVYNEATKRSSCEEPNVSLEEIVEWLQAPSYVDVLKKALDDQMEGTGRWFLESTNFAQFIDGSIPVLWGMGKAGSGKTVLSGISTSKLEGAFSGYPNVIVAHVFIRYTEKPTARDVFAAILGQIAQGHAGTCLLLTPHLRRCKQDRQTRITEKELSRWLRVAVDQLDRMFIVIDGLDEASDPVKDTLLDVLPNLKRTSLLIMSRPLPHLLKAVPAATRISIQALTEDIDLFVRDRLKKSSRLKGMLRGEPRLEDEICTKIKKQSDGMFLVARLQMEVLQTRPNTLKQLRKLLESLPSGLDAMYDATLERIILNACPEDASLARRTLLWLAFQFVGSRPKLSVRALRHALAISYEDEVFNPDEIVSTARLLASCGGLIGLQRRNGVKILRFIHYTTMEYLLRRTDLFDIPCPHAFISVSCLVYWEAHESRYDFSDTAPDLLSNKTVANIIDVELSQDIELPFISYAYHNWAGHASQSYKNLGSTHPYVRRFLTEATTYPLVVPWSPFWPEIDSMDEVEGLHLATAYGFFDVIRSRDLAFRGSRMLHLTPFHIAAAFDQVNSLRVLLASGYLASDLGTKASEGDTPLIVAVGVGAVEVTREILYGSASPQPSTFLDAPLSRHEALTISQANSTSVVALRTPLTPRLDLDIDINARNGDGRTVLMIIAMAAGFDKENMEIMELLLSHPEVECNLQDNNGSTALHDLLLYQGDSNSSTATFLRRAGKRLNLQLRDNEGFSALSAACCADILGKDAGVGAHAEILLAAGDWTISELCNDAIQTLKGYAQGTKTTPYKDRIAQEISWLLTHCRIHGKGVDSALGDDVALVLLQAAELPCRSLIPIVLGWIRGHLLSYDTGCGCCHCVSTHLREVWKPDFYLCNCIHCVARGFDAGSPSSDEEGGQTGSDEDSSGDDDNWESEVNADDSEWDENGLGESDENTSIMDEDGGAEEYGSMESNG